MVRVPRPFICSKKALAFHRTHEEQHFQGLDIRAGRDHIDGNGDARIVAVAKGGDEVLWFRAGGFVGDLLGEIVAFAEFFTHDLHDFVGMAIVLGEDERLGNLCPPRKQVAKEGVLEGADHGANLVGATTSRSSWLAP